MSWLRKLFCKPSDGELRQALQIHHSAARQLSAAAREQSNHSIAVRYQAQAQLKDPAAQALGNLVDFMSRQPDATSD